MGRLLNQQHIRLGMVLVLLTSLVVAVHADQAIDFEGYPDRTPVSELNYPGVTFSGIYIVLTELHHMHDGAFIAPTAGGDTLTIEFDEPQAAFSIDIEGTGPLIQAYLDGELVREELYPTGPYNNEPVGMSNLVFDTLVISEPRLDGSYALDDLTTISLSVDGPPDDRIAAGAGDANVAILYPTGDSIGVYSYQSEDYIENFITVDDIPDEPPAENTIIRQEGNIMVSILPTGEIQFNLGPDAEGKTYTIIMSDIHGSNTYTTYYDPNE